MDRCSSCGATLAPAATWCTQCYAVRGHVNAPAAASVVPGAVAPAYGGDQSGYSIMSGERRQAASRPMMPMVKTRWRKTPTTFGPVGRVAWTVFLVVMLAPMIVGTAVGIIPCVVGLGIWIFIIMPWALRDIWKAGQLPAG
ncbi:MAG TPA: hypothetical protein VG899_17335 [Mycobacteriales bacterium]|nr:hypothetical protein [Mycobacteriales bacterium]